MTLSNLWGRVTGKDKRKQFPDQQGVSLGRVGDYTIIYPYGMHCDLPANTLLRVIAPGIAIPVTVDRPDDAAQGEPMFFHPITNTRIIARNNGNVDVYTNGDVNHFTDGDFNINAVNMNVSLSGNCNIDSILLDIDTTGGSGSLTHNGTSIGDDHVHNGSPSAPNGPVSNTGVPI